MKLTTKRWLLPVPAVLVGSAYALTAKAALAFALVDGTVTPVWPPTGIALAGLLLFGPRVIPGIAVAALVVNLTTGASIAAAGAIAVGNTLAVLVAVGLVRLAGAERLQDLRRTAAFLGLGGLIAMGISATVGASVLALDGSIAAGDLLQTWSVWWAGDAMGVIAVAPPLLLVADGRLLERIRWRLPEFLVLLGLVFLVTIFVFHSELRLLYLVFPLVAWAALRFEQGGAALSIVAVIASSSYSAWQGVGPFAEGSLLEQMITLQVFNSGVAFGGYLLASVVTERRKAMDAARVAGAELEERVRLRTAELQAANIRLRELDALKDSFMTSVSHELRTPLTVVRGIAETLKRPEFTSSDIHRELVERLSVNAIRLERLLEDLLDLDRLRRGTIEPHRRPIHLREVALDVLAGMETVGHPVNVAGDDVVANVDRAQVERIIELLVLNAIKHTPAGCKIWVQVRRTHDGAVVSVADEGPGVDAGMADRIFEPFVQGDPGLPNPGSGIGLSLVRRFAEVHGGRAWVEDRSGGGAAFHVLLPDGDPGRTAPDPRAVAS